MRVTILVLLFFSSFSVVSQDYFTTLFSISLANANDEIYEVLEDSVNNRVYVAGNFTNIASTPRNYLACFNRTTGAIINTFNANIGYGYNYNVKALHLYNGALYIGGYFPTVSGQVRTNCAAIDPSTGALIPTFTCNTNGNVNSIVNVNTNLFVGGNFYQVNSTTRYILAVVSPSTGGVLALTPNISPTSGFGVTKMVAHNSKIYFTTNLSTVIGGSIRNYLAKIDGITCALETWNPNPNSQINDMVIYENELNIIGSFTNIFSTSYNYYVRVSLNTDFPVNTTTVNIFSDITNPYWSCGTIIDNYLGNGGGNPPLNFARQKDMMFLSAFFNVSAYNSFITVLADPNNNNKISSFDYHPCSVPNNGFKFPYMNYGWINYGSNIQGVSYMKTIVDKLYIVTNGTQSTFYPGQKRIEVLGCMPKIPSAFSVSTSTVCAGAQNVSFNINKYAYTKQYIWTYSGTGVTILGGDTSVTLNFATNATSGRLAVKCKGIADRNTLNLSVFDLPIDSVFLNVTVHPRPSVNAGSDLISNCSNNKVVTLNGTVTGNNSIWTGPSSFYNINPSIPVINPVQGNYVLSSTYTATGCSWRDTLFVTVDTLKPNLVMPVITNTRLCCSNPSVTLNANSSTSGVVYNWTNNYSFSSTNPVVISTTSPIIPVPNMTYSLDVTNPSNGCKSNGNLTLFLDTVHPVLGLGVSNVNSKISCITTSISLNGTSGVTKAKLYWNGTGLSTNTPNPATINFPVTYTLMARDTINDCQSYVNYAVLADTAKPTINPLATTKYRNCDTLQVTLNATSPSVNTSFTWTPPTGSNLPNPSFVTNSGTYTITATDINNGCTRSKSLTVVVDTIKPNVTTNVDSVYLSCSVLAYTLNANSTSSPIIINWAGSGGYNSVNPAIVTNQGFYAATIKNTFNGCTHQKQVKVTIDTLKPYIVPFANNYQVNCSYTTAILSGSTIPANQYKLSWTGSAAFSSQNPALVSTPDTYTFTALDTITGCITIKVVNLNYVSTLSLNISTDTVICFGSNASLSVSPIGGTPNYNYTWSNGANSNAISVTPNNTLLYKVTVNDNAGCIGKDSVTVFVPAPVQDSVKTFLPCDPNSPFGQIQTYPYGGIPPYQFAVGSGTFQTSNVFANLILGTYTLTIKDNLGCIKTSTATIDNTSLRPEPNFLITTNMFKSDTFVVVEISNPRPDSVQWSFPASCTVVDNTNPYATIIVNSDTGMFVVNLKAFFGTCEMNKAKTIKVGAIDTTLANNYNNNGIESVTIYPNPNNGQFNVEVKLYKKQTFALLIYDANGIEKYRQTINESSYYNQLINMNPVTTGSFILKVVAEYDAKLKPFIITQ